MELLFKLFVERKWTGHRIAKHFNKLKVDGSDSWNETGIKKMLRNEAYIGVFIWNRTRREFDYEQKKWVVVRNPQSEWEVHIDRKLAIVSSKVWKAARRRLRQMRRNSPLTGKKRSRNQNSATSLFSGTLFCGCCGRELTLYRSTGKYKSVFCLNGRTHMQGCRLSTCKSTRIIEECLLGYIHETIFNDAAIVDLVERANKYLAEEARKPRVKVRPLMAKAKKHSSTIEKLVRQVESEQDEELCDGYHRRIKQLQTELNEIRAEIRKAETVNAGPPQPLNIERVKGYLDDLRGLLHQEIPAAAEAIRTLTGPITIRQELIPGKTRGARWIATFSPDLLRLLRQVARDEGNPDSITLEFLCMRNWITPTLVKITVEKVPKYEILAPKFEKLKENGASIQQIASTHGMCWLYAKQILNFALTGERPTWKAAKRLDRKCA